VYGRFNESKFVSAFEELNAGNFSNNTYNTYLKITIPSSNSMVINSGPYDNRFSIGNIVAGDKYALKYELLAENGSAV
jgi:hypothetical protein